MNTFRFVPEGWNEEIENLSLQKIQEYQQENKTIQGIVQSCDEQCNLHMAYFNGKDNGYYTAPNTNSENQGLVFNQCRLTADSRVEDVSLGRPWQNECYTESIRVDGSTLVTYYDPDIPNPNYKNIGSATTFIDCYMTDQIQNERWNVWTRKHVNGSTVNVTYEDTVFFREYNSMDLDGNLLSPDDYDIVLACAFLYAVMYIVIVFVIDVSYGLIDPRIRLGRG